MWRSLQRLAAKSTNPAPPSPKAVAAALNTNAASAASTSSRSSKRSNDGATHGRSNSPARAASALERPRRRSTSPKGAAGRTTASPSAAKPAETSPAAGTVKQTTSRNNTTPRSDSPPKRAPSTSSSVGAPTPAAKKSPTVPNGEEGSLPNKQRSGSPAASAITTRRSRSPVSTSRRPGAARSVSPKRQTSPSGRPRGRPPYKRNRIIMLCVAQGDKDTPQWPFWKLQHLKGVRGVTDVSMLAVTREHSFVATLRNGTVGTQDLNRRRVKTVDAGLLSAFLDEHYVEDSWFVYGGHGVSDHLEFTKDYRLQVHELAAILGERTFIGMLFDACLMASLDTAYYLRRNARYIGACEGYMWEEDTWGENHVFNPYSATLMTRDSDAKRVLTLVGEEYTRKSSMADFTVLDTHSAERLWDRVRSVHLPDIHAQTRLRPDVQSGKTPIEFDLGGGEDSYDPATVPVLDLKSRLVHAAVDGTASTKSRKRFTDKTVDGSRLVPAPDYPPARTDVGFLVPRSHVFRGNYAVPHALFPAEEADDHIVDLGSCVRDDPATVALMRNVVAWHQGPANASVYSVPELSGLNVALSQYNSASLRLPMRADAAAALERRFQQRATSDEEKKKAAAAAAAAAANSSAASVGKKKKASAVPATSSPTKKAANTPQPSGLRTSTTNTAARGVAAQSSSSASDSASPQRPSAANTRSTGTTSRSP